MIQDLHHIGIAVRSLDEALTHWTEGLGLELQSTEEVATEKIRMAVVLAGSTRIELMEPTASDSPIAGFIEKRGPGIHHLAFKVGDCGEVVKVLTESGATLVGDAPRPGGHGTTVAFLHPRFLGGVLAELVEDPK